jgi:hypothetical protein
VKRASSSVMMSGVFTEMAKYIQPYAKRLQPVVTTKVGKERMRRVSPSGMAMMQIAVMHRKLNDAEPTIVDGPRLPA